MAFGKLSVDELISSNNISVTGNVSFTGNVTVGAGTASNAAISTTGDPNTGIFFPAADNIGFATGGTIRGRWTTDGLCFGSDTAAANALDDYEEGTWTVTLTTGTSGTVTLNSSINEMSYIKIGSQVTVFGRFNISSVSSPVGNLIINLPFSAYISGSDQSDFYAFSVFYHDINLSAGALDLWVEINGNNGTATFFELFDNAAWAAFPSASLKGNGNEYIFVTGSYRAA